jgi:hypothetical protein
MGLPVVRVPSLREYLNNALSDTARRQQIERAKDKATFHATLANMAQVTGTPLGMDPEDLRQFILKGEYEVKQASEAYNLGAMFSSGLALMEELRHFGLEILYAPKDHFFVTSDCPVYTIQPDKKGQATVGMGFGWPDVEVFFPLNKGACLKMKRGLRPRSVQINERRLTMVNDLIMATATQFLYSNENSKRLSRLFDERGCKIRAGRDAFMAEPPDTYNILVNGKRRRGERNQ